MRRVAAVVSLTAALLLACGSFGADPPSPGEPGVDSGPVPSADAGDSGAPPGDDDNDEGDGGPRPIRACQPRFEDNFERNTLLEGPWELFERNGTNLLAILDQGTDSHVLHVETKATVEEVGPHSALLSTGRIVPPKSTIACNFRMKPLVPFASEGGALNDLLVFRLRYADGRKINLRASYTKNSDKQKATFMVRDDRFGTDGKCIEGKCPAKIEFATNSDQSTTAFTAVRVGMTYDSFTVVDGDNPVMRTNLGLEKPESIEILFGIVAFSPYSQEAYFDDLSCAFDCE